MEGGWLQASWGAQRRMGLIHFTTQERFPHSPLTCLLPLHCDGTLLADLQCPRRLCFTPRLWVAMPVPCCCLLSPRN